MSTSPPPTRSVSELHALRRRQPDAVEAWFNDHADAIYRFVFYRVGKDLTLAADVSQDVFVTALEKIEEYDHQRGEMFPWLTYIARNCIRKALRQRSRYETAGDLWDSLDVRLAASLAALNEAPLPPEVLESEQTNELVRFALSNIPSRYQRALHLRYYEQLSTREIADDEGTSVGAVKVLLHRARQAFRSALEAIAETVEQGRRSEGTIQ